MKNRYKITEKDGVYFLTSTIVEWLPVFTSQAYFEVVINSLKFCQQQKDLLLYAFVILDNHFHLIAAALELAGTIASLKKFTAREIIALLHCDRKDWPLNQSAYYKKRYKVRSDYQVGQEGSHPQLIQSEEMLLQKIEYNHSNPVKRGLVDSPEHWRYSSARSYVLADHSLTQLTELPV